MKKEIIKLIKSEGGTFRLNNISYLYRWTQTGTGEKCDGLELYFSPINNVEFCGNVRIVSRDYDGIITECQEATTSFLTNVAFELNKNMRAGYRNI